MVLGSPRYTYRTNSNLLHSICSSVVQALKHCVLSVRKTIDDCMLSRSCLNRRRVATSQCSTLTANNIVADTCCEWWGGWVKIQTAQKKGRAMGCQRRIACRSASDKRIYRLGRRMMSSWTTSSWPRRAGLSCTFVPYILLHRHCRPIHTQMPAWRGSREHRGKTMHPL